MVGWGPPNKLSHRKLQKPEFRPFRDAVGAVDGTHIACHPPKEMAGHFLGRKDVTTFNIMAVCDFNLRITYVLSGVEGVENDSSVFQLAKSEYRFSIPAGKYVLGDAGYAMGDQVITPHAGHKYHLPAWKKSKREPANAQENFNHSHSSLRMAVERVFGVMKHRYKVCVSSACRPRCELKVR